MPCPSCGLPAAGEAALVIARIGATIDELARDRDRLLHTLRAAAPAPAYAPAPAPATGPAPRPPAPRPGPVTGPPVLADPPLPGPAPVAAPLPRARRVSPQQVLLGLGALLVVAAAIAFVAVAWTRLGIAFQATVMVTAAGVACGVSAWTARRGLRATEEALAAAGAALLAVDLASAHALGLLGLDAVPPRTWAAVSCGVVAGAALVLGRLTRSTVTWPLVALLALQPVPLLLVPVGALAGPAGVGAALGLALLDLVAGPALRRAVARVAVVLTAGWAGLAALGGVVLAWEGRPADSWTATGLLAAAGALALLAGREPRLAAALPPVTTVAAGGASVAAFALTGSLGQLGLVGTTAAGALGTGLLAVAVPAAALPVARAGLVGGGGVLAAVASLALLGTGATGGLALVLLLGTVPAGLAAWLLPGLRRPATATALAAPALAALLAPEAGLLDLPQAGLVVALVAVAGLALATARAGRPEEPVAAATGAALGAVAGITSASAGAWGQVGLQLALAGGAAACYGVVTGRRPAAVAAVADLVLAAWVALAGAGVGTPEAYTLPAAAGLLVVALPGIRSGARSWAAEGPAVAAALLPSALVVVADPSALRLVLVVAAAGALTVTGTLTHRQAPFLVGAGALAWVVLGRLGPYAPLVPRWVTLAVVGLLLLVVGATYERRRQQAREAVAWVAQMR
ncbi:DUF2157 domain-containing protein [Geodermatophilus marinus]|nr:DUF2157 domain-containing protein [Geodermatophilus sp. LHW52908]